ncbi:MAG: TPM domain-containing protein [Bacteroidaceae bacterium]|nr:TPM domain-containing protein [Bacteroidaceae bacterium]
MKRLAVISTLLLLAIRLAAAVYTPTSIPMVHLADRNRYVCNPDHILSEEAVSRIDAIFRQIEDSTGIQTVIAVVEGIDPDDCFEFTYQLLEKNGVGQKDKNNGLAITLSTTERCIQFVTGYGLEGVLPDAICKRIQVNYMNPSFSDGNWDQGMIAGAEALYTYLVTPEMMSDLTSDSDDDAMLVLIIFLSIFGLSGILIAAGIYFDGRCPKCHRKRVEQTSSTLLSKADGVKTHLIIYECPHCGYVFSRKKQTYYDDGHHHHGGGSFGAGSFGSGGFGGGGFGGSFGGGHSGGGGAGSRF